MLHKQLSYPHGCLTTDSEVSDSIKNLNNKHQTRILYYTKAPSRDGRQESVL